MDDNSNNKTTYEVVNLSTKEKNKGNASFSKSVLLPFFSGILGTSLVIGTCFGVPQIREKIICNSSTLINTSTSRY